MDTLLERKRVWDHLKLNQDWKNLMKEIINIDSNRKTNISTIVKLKKAHEAYYQI